MYHQLVEKVNASRITTLKVKYQADQSELEKKILMWVNVLKKQIAIIKLLK